MIYIKKKSFIKRIFNIKKISFRSIEKRNNINFFKLLKGFFCLFILCLIALYAVYLCFLPQLVKEKDVENYINSFLSKNTKFSFDIDNIKINPNYKFDINLKASKIRLIYPNKSNFIVIENLNTNVNLITLLFKKLDINKVDIKNLEFNTNFSKGYDFLNYINLDIFNENSKIPVTYLKVNIENFNLNLYDKNIDKTYQIKANKVKLSKFKNNVNVCLFGLIKQKNKTIVDFKSNLSFELKEKSLSKLKDKLLKLNYNPFLYADKYNFYLKSDINLKYNTNKNTLNGYIDLKDFTFSYLNFNIPKNNLIINFKNDNIYTNCKLNLIKNQFINLELKANPNKYAQAKILSSDIDLNDLSGLLKTFLKIINVKYDFNNIDLKGKLKADVFLKSNFKTLVSSGKLNIIDAKVIMKKPYFVINNINSNVNFSDNVINIIDTSAFINQEKFYLKGTIDNKTNLNLDINSENIDIASFLDFVKNLPIISNYKNDFEKITIQKGFLKAAVKIKGNLKEPLIQSNSNIHSLKAYIKKANSFVSFNLAQIKAYPKLNNIGDIFVDVDGFNIKNKELDAFSKKLNLTIKENDIVTNDFEINVQTKDIKLNNAKIKATVKNYKNNPSVLTNIKGNISNKNNLFKLKNSDEFYNFDLNSTIIQNKLLINGFHLFSKNTPVAELTGEIDDFDTNPNLNIKLTLPNKLAMNLYNPELDFEIKGSANITKTLKNPNIEGLFFIQNINSQKFGLKVENLNLNIKNSTCKINILKGNLFNSDFSLIAEMKLLKDKLLFPYLKFSSNYINVDNLLKYQGSFDNLPLEYEISDLKGNIQILENKDFTLNALDFKGKLINNVLTLDSYKANLYDGTVEGNLSYNLKTNLAHTTTLLKAIGIRHFSNQLKAFSIAASGRLSSMIDAKFYLTADYNALIKSSQGYIKFNIDDGELNQFAKLERFLQAGNILSQSIFKLNLNSMLSTVTKQNTGYFKTIEGTIKLENAKGNIQYIKTQGQNMSMYIKGYYDLLTNNASIKVLGKIPLSIVSVMGNIGKTTIEDIVNKEENKEINAQKSNLTVLIPNEEINKIPSLLNEQNQTQTRLFSVIINGDVTKVSSIKSFRWINSQ